MFWMSLVFAACGRSGFVPGGECDGATGDGARDGNGDAPQADPSLLIHLTFDNAADLGADSSGFHNDAVCQNCPFQAVGRVGAGAATFSNGDCLAIADVLALRPTSFTAALWMNAGDGGGNFMSMFARPFDGATASSNTFDIDYRYDITQLTMAVDDTGRNSALTPNWHHLALVFDGAQVAEFVDGTLAVNTYPVGAAPYGPDDLRIGCDFDGGGEDRYYFGLIDDLRFYNRTLTASEIAALAAM
jgi:hypothetical protein